MPELLVRRLLPALVCCTFTLSTHAAQTIGGGTLTTAANGPDQTFGVGAGGDFVLVKNWDFGTSGTINNQAVMNQQFQYHDQFGTFANGTKYGAYTVAPDTNTDTTYAGTPQPVEYYNTNRAVREFYADSLRTYLVPRRSSPSQPVATFVNPTTQKAGAGSFQAKFTLPTAGSRLGQDLIWETRVRYVTPPYFWFALWTSGNVWNNGAEIDVVESFGYDNGGGYTNFDGHYWHSGSVGGDDDTYYHSNWGNAMASRGVTNFNASIYHTWTLLYRTDDTYSVYMDGIEVQSGDIDWTIGGLDSGTPINMSFIFDAAWGHKDISSVNKTLAASALANVYYEFDYSRIYLSSPFPPLLGDANNDGIVDGIDLLIVEQQFGSTGNDNGWLLGDANDDGRVDGYDTLAVERYFGARADGLNTPEPAALAAFFVLLPLARARRASIRRNH